MAATDHPDISVIVPVYQQWSDVRAMLDALEKAAVEHETGPTEVLVVNNGVLEDATAISLPPGVRVIHCEQPGSYAARNAGAALARGGLLVFIDADCRPELGWLPALQNAGRAFPGQVLAGPVRMVASRRPSLWERYDLVRGIPQESYVRHGYAATANLAVPRRVFEALGGFDPARLSGGDAEFCRRAAVAGNPVRLVPTAIVHHAARTTASQVITKARRTKGGQLPPSGNARLAWVLLAALPPLPTIAALLTRRPHSLRDRLSAGLVAMLLWPVLFAEAIRLVRGGRPERR